MKYIITLELSMGDLLSPVREVEDSVNKTMAGFGFSEKMFITSQLPLHMTVARPLTTAEQQAITNIVLQTYGEKFKHVNLISFVPETPSELV